MCNKRNSVTAYFPRENKNPKINAGKYRVFSKCRVDNCMRELISLLNARGIETLACCCGHGRYNISIVYRSSRGKNLEMVSGIEIKRQKRFYVTDNPGYYYIPELYKKK